MSKKDRSGPAGPIFKIQACERPKTMSNTGVPGRWAPAFDFFDKLPPGKGMGVEVLNKTEANRISSALNGHAGIYLREHPEAGWRLKTTSSEMPNGHVWFYGEKYLTSV